MAPPRVAAEVWPEEAKRWRPDLRVVVVRGTPSQRKTLLAREADVHVLSRDVLKNHTELPSRWRTLIIDELSGFKSRSSVRWRAARKILKDPMFANVWGLTGTPSPNGLLDLWSQVFLLDSGERLGKTLGGYRSRYFTPGRQLSTGVITEWNLRPGADKRIHSKLEDICLSMDTEGRVDLPPVTENVVSVPMKPAVSKVYQDFKRDLVADLDVLGGEIHTAGNAAILSGRLSQLTAGFLYSDDAEINGGAYDVIHQEKLGALEEIISGTGSPLLVFHRFRAEREMIAARWPDLVHTIDEPDVIARWNRGEIPLLLAHPASAGHGLNLQHGGHTIVWTTLPWSLEEWQQANKRLARSGQRHPVVIHSLETPRTIDGAVAARLRDKTSVQEALLSHLRSPL